MVCVPRPAGELRFAWGLILLLALPLAAHGQMGWRFWTAADGMAESYSQSVGIAPDGTAWIRHGQVSTMSVLNGYSVSQIAEPRATREVNWGLLARVHGGSPGEAWTIEDGVLKRYVNQRWTGCDAPPWRDPMLGGTGCPGRIRWPALGALAQRPGPAQEHDAVPRWRPLGGIGLGHPPLHERRMDRQQRARRTSLGHLVQDFSGQPGAHLGGHQPRPQPLPSGCRYRTAGNSDCRQQLVGSGPGRQCENRLHRRG